MSRRRRAALPAAAIAAWLLVAAGAAGRGPELEIAADGAWHLSAPPPVLAEEEVRRHLETGLTATLAFRIESQRRRGGARVDVRYELWDEVYHAVAVGIDGRAERRRFASFDELVAWWRDLHLVVFAASGTAPPPPGPAEIRLELLPFSRAEQDDTRRWFSDSLDKAASSSAEEVARAADEQAENLSRVLNLVMATSIQRRPLATWRWNGEATAGRDETIERK